MLSFRTSSLWVLKDLILEWIDLGAFKSFQLINDVYGKMNEKQKR